MELKQFLGLQVFEFAYLMALAFLPFFVAQREVGLTIMAVAFVYLMVATVRFFWNRHVSAANKVVLITGCDSGFGNALAKRLSSNGFTVVAGCLDKGSDGAQFLKSESARKKIHVLPLDVTSDDSVDSALRYVRETFPSQGLWALVNNAGVMERGGVEFASLESYRRVAEVNLFGAIRTTKAFLPMVRSEKGRVVNISGSVGRMGLPSMSAFSVSCHGLEAFSDSLRHEMRPFGVEVVVVEPGNYYGSTGLQNRAALPEIRAAFERMGAEASGEVVRAYGKDFMERQYQALAAHSRTAAGSLAPVVDALEAAVARVRVRPRYLVDGSNTPFDLPNFLIRWEKFLPQRLVDHLVKKNFQVKA